MKIEFSKEELDLLRVNTCYGIDFYRQMIEKYKDDKKEVRCFKKLLKESQALYERLSYCSSWGDLEK